MTTLIEFFKITKNKLFSKVFVNLNEKLFLSEHIVERLDKLVTS